MKYMKQSNRGLGRTFSLLIVLSMLTGCNQSPSENNSLKDNLTENLEEIAVDLNKMAPMSLDEETRFDKAEVSGNTLMFNYTILTEISDTDVATLKSAMQNAACQEKRKEIDFYNSIGADAMYIYHDKQGVKLTEFEITNQVCDTTH